LPTKIFQGKSDFTELWMSLSTLAFLQFFIILDRFLPFDFRFLLEPLFLFPSPPFLDEWLFLRYKEIK